MLRLWLVVQYTTQIVWSGGLEKEAIDKNASQQLTIFCPSFCRVAQRQTV